MTAAAIARVIETIREQRRIFEAFCYGLTEEQLDRRVPGSSWIVRDFAAHLGTLDVALLRWADAAAAGDMQAPSRGDAGERFDVDQFNDARVAERRGWPLVRVFAEATGNRERLIAALERIPAERLEEPMRFPGDAKRPGGDIQFGQFLRGWARHDAMHAADMMKALPDVTLTPEQRQWLADPLVAAYQSMMNPGHGRTAH
jgi:hypothetical protein